MSTNKSVLLILTSHDALGNTSIKTGTWLEELAAAYWTFIDAGFAVELASIQGGRAPLDPMSLGGDWLQPFGKRFLADAASNAKLGATLSLEAVDPAQFCAIYLVGGAGTAYDFPGDTALSRVLSAMLGRKMPVAAVCHGTLGLLSARDSAGRALIAGKRVTGVSNAEEAIAQYDKVLPLLPQNALEQVGARYSCAPTPFAPHVVEDEGLLTGQNPASAALLAQAVLARLRTLNVA